MQQDLKIQTMTALFSPNKTVHLEWFAHMEGKEQKGYGVLTFPIQEEDSREITPCQIWH